MHKASSDDLHLNAENMKMYIGGQSTLRIVLHMLQDEMDKGFRTIYPKAMEARVRFKKDVTKWYGNKIA